MVKAIEKACLTARRRGGDFIEAFTKYGADDDVSKLAETISEYDDNKINDAEGLLQGSINPNWDEDTDMEAH